MKLVYETKEMVGECKGGNAKFWQAKVFELETGEIAYETYSWQTRLKTGEKSLVVGSGLTKVKGKNIGKKNETTPLDQAIFNVESKLRKKIDSNYEYSDGTPINREHGGFPMLAHKYEFGQKKALPYPVFIQPKFNGVRCLFNGEMFWSRKGKPWTTCDHLKFNTEGLIVDGELLLPPHYPLQMTGKATKKLTDLSKELIYVLYDIKDATKTYEQRKEMLEELAAKNGFPINVWGEKPHDGISICPTEMVHSEDELKLRHDTLSANGWEGTMIRFPNSLYTDKRSRELLKVKDFEDAEFEIIDFTAGENGNEQGCIIFTCKVEEGDGVFNVRPAETFEERREMYAKGEEFIGKKYTVKFKDRSDDGIPLLPVGICFREDGE